MFKDLVDNVRNGSGQWGEPAGDLIEFLAYTGLRIKSEARWVEWADVDWKRKEIVVRGEQAQGMRGHKSLSFAEKQNHHIFPQQFRDTFKQIAKGKFDIDAFGVRMNEAFHLKGLHGGGYNKMFDNFRKKNLARIKKDPMFLIGFGFGMMNEMGFGNYGVVPF